MADEFAVQTSNFLEWFRNLPGATFSDSIEIADLRSRGAGRGIVATRDIPADTTLFTIPRGSIISTETSEVARRLPQVFDLSAVLEDDGEDAGAGLDSWACLILVLVHEHLRGDASPWKAYLDVALPPAGAFDTPMFWSADELAELQTGPAAGKIGRAEAEDMFRNKIIPVAREREREDPSLFPGAGAMTEEELVELAHRVGSSIMAYAFDLEPEGGESDEGEEEQEGWVEDREGRSLMGMVPMADMLNADAEFNAHINHGDDALTATTLRDIRAGEEVLNYYGPHPNSELLRRYGYVTARHARYDVVEVPWALIEQAVAEQLGLPTDVVEKARGLLDEDEIEDTFVLERTTPDPGPDGTFPADAPPAAFTVPPPDLAEQLKAFLKAAKKVQPGSGVEDKRKRDEVAQSALVRCLGVLEAAYATTLEQDEALLAACAEENSSSSDRRKRMALVVRMGEKRLIREAREVLGAGESSEEGRAKRTKLDG